MRLPSFLTARGNGKGEDIRVMTSVSAENSHIETGLALSEENNVEVISLNIATPRAPDEYFEDQTKSGSKNGTNDIYVYQSLIAIRIPTSPSDDSSKYF